MTLQDSRIAPLRGLPQTNVYALSGGAMHLTIDEAEMPVEEMLRLAERQNPKRAFLFVSRILGRHIPVAPSLHRQALDRLARGVIRASGTAGGMLVMGFAETAIGLGAGVHDAILALSGMTDAAFLPSTRHPGDDPVWFSFSEDHSHAMAHHVLEPSDPAVAHLRDTARTLVLVDDEVTTGATFANLIRSMRAAGRWPFERICIVTLTDWSGGKARALVSETSGLPLEAISAVSLARGSWNWIAAEGAAKHEIPSLAPALDVEGIPAGIGGWRRGLDGATPVEAGPILERALCRDGNTERVLVIGTGENVWHPFRMAEEIERLGFETGFLATTRSPVLQGETIRHKIVFSDHYGLGIPMYLHNVDPDEWGMILVMIEREDARGIDPRLAAALGTFTAVTPSGNCLNFRQGKLTA
ncbi:phosphoribosyltransferase domain-containing protein [Defluviimonas salinarum]|uniref:Phosphoribosyltransferase family protein n=1 Tax=Defluviimonas salinarum TaxID=2992147 RepID=A0ABT3J4A4_9RHOB|nr:phosphoribosyltransferase domain-containing protein [Defluviimonas salinarum]MCW3782527.1 phosphoribosyltransferase family protein [Defluviimonas salinarum]